MLNRRIELVMVGALLLAVGLGLRLFNGTPALAWPQGEATAQSGVFTVTLEAGDYTLLTGDDGQTHIQMAEDFGSFGAPGEPQLPGRSFLIALPPGAQVTDVRFETPEAVTLPGRYRIAPVGLTVFDPGDLDRARAQWEANRERAYASDEFYPERVGEYLGQGQWRRYTIARVAYRPFTYRPRSGILRFHPRLVVTIEYRPPEPDSPAWHELQRLSDDHVLDDLIAPHLVNADQARAWYGDFVASPLTTASSLYDYVIIVENDAMATVVNPLKTWKESLGHTVKVVTLDWIHANYSGVDVAEKVWNFLHDKYPASQWGIRYVLLVGDLRVITTRRIYYSNPPSEWGLRSDHFFAKLSGGDTSEQVWNKDSDRRWGEIDGDEMSVVPDVLVGRIPLNDATNVGNAIQAMINFEQDIGTWKHKALLAGGYNDIKSATQKTDNAVLMEYIRNHLLDPNGWTYTRIYEQTGLGTSTYTPPPDYDTSQANVVAAWNASDHGLAILADHGSTRGLSGHIWVHDTLTRTGQVDPGEWAWSTLFDINDVNTITNTHPAIVELMGCSTLMLVGPRRGQRPSWPPATVDEHGVPYQPFSYADNTGRRFLATGRAAGVVGFASPVPYRLYWSKPTTSGSQTISYYFTENLVQNHYTLGWSFYEAKIRYTNNYYSPGAYEPIPWAFSLFGDPSMILEGYDTSARGKNRVIHTGPVYAYGTDNDDNGDMYVAVSTRPSTEDGEIKVYRSTDHGETWSLWTTVGWSEPILAVDLVVGRWKSGEEFRDNRVHVFFTDTAGEVMDARVDMANPGNKNFVTIATEGAGVDLPAISAARDPVSMPSAFNLYVAWEVDLGGSHQVKVARSTVNGATWANQFAYSGYQQPHVDAGPNSHVYLVAVGDNFPNDVYVKRSTDKGVTWGGWTNLTSGDNASYHGAPVVAASTDAAIPTVWVAYNYYQTVAYGGSDLRLAYSTDGGGTWTKNRILSAEQGFDELMPDMVGYRTGSSRWMNIAYNHSKSARTNVVWRWSSGSTPNNWWAPRLMNDHDTHPAMGPQIIYSPGAPATGSGVVYPGTGSPVTNLYFAAPWLTPTGSGKAPPLPAPGGSRVRGASPPSELGLASPQVSASSKPISPQATSQDESSYWAFTGEAGKAFRVAGLAWYPGGPLFAAATTREINEANTGTVFRSDNGGETWEAASSLPAAWWLEDILVTEEGTLLASGMMYEPEEAGVGPQGVIYRSTDLGQSWSVVAAVTEATLVHTLLQRADGSIVAGTGPGGLILISFDDGQHWEPWPVPPNAEHIYALLETEEGTLYAGGMRANGTGVVYRFTGEGWEETGALDNATAVNALLEGSNHVLYAGAACTDETGRVFRSFNGGTTWESSLPLGNSRAVRALVEGAGAIYAGLDMGPGLFTAYVYVSEDGGETWHNAGSLFMADAVHDFLLTPDGALYAASGDLYGVIYRAEFAPMLPHVIHLPLILRNLGTS